MAALNLLCNLIITAFLVMILCRLPHSYREHLICNTLDPAGAPIAHKSPVCALKCSDCLPQLTVAPADAAAHKTDQKTVEKWESWQPRYRILTALTLDSFNAAAGTN